MVLNTLAALQRKRVAGGSFSPGDLSPLVWIDTSQFAGLSDNDPISTATDASGNGNNFTQTGGARPTYKENITNSLPAMLFVHSSSQFLTRNTISATAATWWIVYQPDTITAIEVEIVGSGPGTSYYRFSGDGNGYFGAYRNARINGYPTAVPTSGINILVGLSTDSTYNIWINGSAQGAQSADFDAGPVGTINLGADSGGGKTWNGYIFEFGMCGSDQTASRSSLETYLTDKWT